MNDRPPVSLNLAVDSIVHIFFLRSVNLLNSFRLASFLASIAAYLVFFFSIFPNGSVCPFIGSETNQMSL